MRLSAKILSFLENLDCKVNLPAGIEIMNPFKSATTFNYCEKFYNKFYNDTNPRYFIFGINPGRFGAGLTGIPFTDPIRLQNICGIENDFPKKQELSAVFIYEMIDAFGGPEIFYSKFYISGTSPLGFIKNNKNLNYYDDPLLQQGIKKFVVECIHLQLEFGMSSRVAFCLGEGKNFVYLSKLNKEMNFFDKVIALPHPRFIMQYRLKRKDEYIRRYVGDLAMSD
jgi:hypothetical protein